MGDRLLGTLAVVAAPITLAVGITLWDKHWAGSPYMLNLWKCSLMGSLFVLTAAVMAMATADDDWGALGGL